MRKSLNLNFISNNDFDSKTWNLQKWSKKLKIERVSSYRCILWNFDWQLNFANFFYIFFIFHIFRCKTLIFDFISCIFIFKIIMTLKFNYVVWMNLMKIIQRKNRCVFRCNAIIKIFINDYLNFIFYVENEAFFLMFEKRYMLQKFVFVNHFEYDIQIRQFLRVIDVCKNNFSH